MSIIINAQRVGGTDESEPDLKISRIDETHNSEVVVNYITLCNLDNAQNIKNAHT